MFGIPVPEFLVRPLAYALMAIALVLFGRWWGAHGVYTEWMTANEQARIAAVKVIDRQQVITEKVVVQYRDRIHEVQVASETVTKEIPVYVPPSADPVLPLGWRLLHDAAAAARSLSPPAPGLDVTAADTRASAAIGTVSHNYATCAANAVQLEELQGWVRSQFEISNGQRLEYGADPP